MSNPFSNNKREGEIEKIFLFYPDMESWFSNNNFIFEGGRGSGKTSILSAFNYENVWLQKSEVVCNEDIQKHYEETAPSFIGVIFKCESHDKGIWDRWANKHGQDNAAVIYSTYLNYYFLEKIIEALNAISTTRDLSKKTYSDNKFIQLFIDTAFPARNLRPKIFDYSLDYLQTILRDHHNIIRSNVVNLSSLESLSDFIHMPESSCKLLIDECKLIQANYEALKDTLFFILIDDVNKVSEWQTKCINNLIISYHRPISFKISSVSSLYKTKATHDPERPLGNSDAAIISLDNSDPTKISKHIDIERILDMIFKTRIKQVYPDAEVLDINKIFGKEIDINKSLITILKASQKVAVNLLMEEYNKSEIEYFTDFWLRKNDIKTYNSAESELEVIKEKSEFLKKYRVSAAFSIIQEYKLGSRFEYYSMQVINHLICGSVRRFLKICELLWPIIEKQLSKDNKVGTISSKYQSSAIKKCAEYVYNGIDSTIYIRHGIKTTNQDFCNRLAKIFLAFISKDSLRKSTECLSLRIEKNSIDESLLNVINSIVLSEAFIKDDKDTYILIGLHPVLSPKYRLPYRTPFYYSQSISQKDLELIISYPDAQFDKIVAKLLSDRTKNMVESNLFNQKYELD